MLHSTPPLPVVQVPSRPTPGFAVRATLWMLLLHGAIWSALCVQSHQSFGELLSFWDSAHYTTIARY